MESPLSPQRADAERFLELLEPGGMFWFQTAPEPKSSGSNAPRVLHGTLASQWDNLAQINAQRNAVWVQINAGAGRRDDQVTKVRSYFVDKDEGDGDVLFAAAVPADIIVESSPGKLHAYWLTKDCPLELFKPRQRALAHTFGGDLTVCNLGRVMRLPGLVHWKGEPLLSRIAHVRAGLS